MMNHSMKVPNMADLIQNKYFKKVLRVVATHWECKQMGMEEDNNNNICCLTSISM